MSERTVRIGDDEFTFKVSRDGSMARLENGRRIDEIEVLSMGASEAELRINGRRVIVPFVRRGGAIWLALDGETIQAEVSAGSQQARNRHAQQSMTAPMPGVVLKIFVAPGDVVTRGDPLIVLEAMKMEHQISAPYDGTVESIGCTAGELVQAGVELISITPAEPA